MQVDGGCHCGAITFTADVNPANVSICHCTDCQRLTGTAFRVAVPTQASSVKISGEPHVYIKTTADSGARRRQTFCPNCGSPIYASADTDAPEIMALRWGAIRQRAELAPRKQIWRKSALDWAFHLDEAPSRLGEP